VLNTAITYLQIFGIGFSFGVAGPCLLICAPILITYIAGKQTTWRHVLSDIFMFFVGRLLAYLILGYLAGLSGSLLRQFSSSDLLGFFKPLGGLIIILLGISVLAGKESSFGICKFAGNKVTGFGSLFVLGFITGLFPCAPLLALLFDIALISKTAMAGMFYALFFGLGTLVSGLIVVGSLAGILAWLPSRIFKSKRSNFVFRTICALLLVLLGLGLVFGPYPYIEYRQ
jgi:sulfite exporter TauE/SafE